MFETNYAPANPQYETYDTLYESQDFDERGVSNDNTPTDDTHTLQQQETKNYKKNRESRYNNILSYFTQLKKISKVYLTHQEIKEVYETVNKYERAILSTFYFMDIFFEGLNEIRKKFKIKSTPYKTIKNSSQYTKEQYRLITRISRKRMDKNEDKEKEINRVRYLLESICARDIQSEKLPVFQIIFEHLPFRNNSYADFITYLEKMVKGIEKEKWGKKTKNVAKCLEKYLGVTYFNIRKAFRYLEKISQLNFENKYYYKKPLLELKRKIKEIQDTGLFNDTLSPKKAKNNSLDYDLIVKSINQVEPYELAITKLFNDFSEKYFRFVVFLAKKYINGKLPFSDIIQEGNIGLLKAVKKYNCELGHKFITYAYWWIRQGISRALADQSRTIRIPIHVQQEFRNIKKTTQRLKKELWKDPDLKQISDATGKNEKQINSLFEIFEDPLSLTHELSEGSGSTLSSFNADTRAINPATALERATLRHEINHHLGYLSEREAIVIEMRYGLKDGNESTLEEVAKLLQVTRERIRQIEVKALNILKKKGERKLKPYLNNNYELVDCFSTL